MREKKPVKITQQSLLIITVAAVAVIAAALCGYKLLRNPVPAATFDETDKNAFTVHFDNEPATKAPGETESRGAESTANPEGLVNINTASKEELMKLRGIGEKKAEAIIEYRRENGDFKNLRSIMRVSGIGEKVFEEIKDYICI